MDAVGINQRYNRHLPRLCNTLQYCNKTKKYIKVYEKLDKNHELAKHNLKLSKRKRILTKELKQPKSKTERIPIELLSCYKELGKGNFRKGLIVGSMVCEEYTNNGGSINDQILIQQSNRLLELIKILKPKAYYQAFGHFQPFFIKFLKTMEMDYTILKKDRKEKTINEFKTQGGND